jgi:hypothetical protein
MERKWDRQGEICWGDLHLKPIRLKPTVSKQFNIQGQMNDPLGALGSYERGPIIGQAMQEI